MLKGLISLTIIFLGISVFGQINTGSPTMPFGSNTSYEYGLMPTNLPSSGTYGASSDVGTEYNTWKTKYVENCGSTMARVKFDNTSQTVSEGIAYGMLIAVYAGDKDLFNRLWAFYKNNRNVNGVMNWKINGCSAGTSGFNGATDAELDAAMALIVATKQWPGTTSPHNYTSDGIDLITAIRDWETAPDGTFYNGDLWHPDCRNPSYQAPGYARAYKLFMAENGANQNTYWDNVAAKTETLFKNNAHASSGLSTNWCLPSGIPNSSCSGSGTAPDKFGYDACRAPWRQAVDVLWWSPASTGDVQTVINRQATFWENKGGATTVQGSNNVNHDGSGSGDHNGAFTGMIGAMALGASSSHQSFCNALYTENLKSTMDRGYFTGILRIIGLFVQTGNFWNPYGTTNGGGDGNNAPTVSLTSPSDNLSICLGESITIIASAADSDGSISKVEFYDGNTLIVTETSAPYSRAWTFTTSGSKSIKAIAYDNENETTTSSLIEVTINDIPSSPTVTASYDYCKNTTAAQLSASGASLKWYTQASNGTSSTTAPTPSTNNEAVTDYYVSQTVNGCESDRSNITVTVSESPDAPSTTSVDYCRNESASQLTASGVNLKWYTQASNGTGSTTAPTPSTNNEGVTNYYVSQTVNGCESDRNNITITVNSSPDVPSTTSVDYCKNESASQLTASGVNLKWYTQASNGTSSTTAPTPNTSTTGSSTYYVSQTVNGCESLRESLDVSVIEATEPTVVNVDYCQGESSVQLTATGQSLKWYTSSSSNNSSGTAPTPSTNVIGNTSYYVSQTVNGCESDRSEIVVSVGNATSAPATNDVEYCQNENATSLIATGTNLVWYTSATETSGDEILVPNTDAEGITIYYVSQTVNGCESERSMLSVTVNATPDAPEVTSQILYSLNEEAEQLTASGTNLLWYTSATGGIGNATAPSPSTNVVGITSYYVAQESNNGCEGDRSEIEVVVFDALVVNKTNDAPLIDGVIDDIWTVVNGVEYSNVIQGSIANANDLSGTFKLLWDEDNFYVLGEVIDDSKVNDSGQLYQDDAVELFFDFGNKKETSYEDSDDQYTFRWNDNVATSRNGQLTGVTFDMMATSNGYTFEASFPWSTLGGSGVEGDLHGFEFEVNDDDNGGNRDGKIAWNATEDEAWRNPSLFGEIILGEELVLCEKPDEVGVTNSGSVVKCEGESLTVAANEVPGAVYKWFKDDSALSGETESVINVSESGSYKVRIADGFIDNSDCYIESEVSDVVFAALPTPTIVGALTACIFSPTEIYEYSTDGEIGSSYKWEVGNAVIKSGENQADMTVEFSTGLGTEIQLIETDANGCVGTEMIYVEYDCVTGTSDESLSQKAVFPNPFTDVIFVEDFTSYEVFDISGRMILYGEVESGTINTESLNSAVYVVKLSSEEGVKILKMNKE